ncbi:MAG: prepilin peptidase [Deltaproteobacteria bacterium]|nr:prepilin peptidase [Deltaproteobacteria bacterium]
MNLPIYTQAVATLLLCGAAAWTDYRTGRIPNRLTVTGLCFGLTLGLITQGIRGGVLAGVGALLTALVPLLLFRFRAMGGGDVKLFAAIGSLVGAQVGLELQMLAFIFGAFQGVIVWLRAGQLRQGFGHVVGLIIPPIFRARRADAGAVAVRQTEIRFGPAIFVAAVTSILCRLAG